MNFLIARARTDRSLGLSFSNVIYQAVAYGIIYEKNAISLDESHMLKFISESRFEFKTDIGKTGTLSVSRNDM